MDKRFSRKREAIIECLKNTIEHPSAEWVYAKLKPDYPDLSLGTVYRNLKELSSAGDICSVGVVNDKERFDARTEPHAHAICAKCGRILDVEEVTFSEKAVEKFTESTGFTPVCSRIQFFGICAECKDKNEST